jgi:predicted DNA-binding antitoxin AbrB/MazE fold protein
MSTTVRAIYENGMLRPLGPVNLAEREQVTLTIDQPTGSSADQVDFRLDAEAWRAFTEALDAGPKVIPTLRKLLTEASVFDGNGNLTR